MGKNQVGFLKEKTGQKTCIIPLKLFGGTHDSGPRRI
jgi:hypothetical protein